LDARRLSAGARLERFKQFSSHCFAAARAAGLHQQLGQCVPTQPLRCRRTPETSGARRTAATLFFQPLYSNESMNDFASAVTTARSDGERARQDFTIMLVLGLAAKRCWCLS
jgi:hypothetical protein